MVREALVTSVTCTPPSTPPVRFHSTQQSVLPKTRSPASAFSRAPSTFSRIHTILVPEKYVASGRPDLLLEPVGAAVRRQLVDDGLGAGVLPDDRVVDGLPVVLSQTTAVSRWLVMPTAAMSCRVRLALDRARADDLAGVVPDLRRVVLDPAGLREDLLVLHLAGRDDAAGVVEDDRAGAGGALVDGEDVLAHVDVLVVVMR